MFFNPLIMKIRNHRKYEWRFRPYKDSKLEKHLYVFKYKSSLMKFLNKHFKDAINGTVTLDQTCFGGSGSVRQWFVWYNDYALKGTPVKIELRQLSFRGSKYIFKPSKIEKISKKYFAFSDKVISLMSNIYELDEETILPKNAKRLIDLFKKRGFKDFEPTEEEWHYINGHINDGIQFSYWSDRCNFLRCKVILEYFKREGLIN